MKFQDLNAWHGECAVHCTAHCPIVCNHFAIDKIIQLPFLANDWNSENHVIFCSLAAFVTRDIQFNIYVNVHVQTIFLHFRFTLKRYCCRFVQVFYALETAESGNCIIINVNDTWFFCCCMKWNTRSSHWFVHAVKQVDSRSGRKTK